MNTSSHQVIVRDSFALIPPEKIKKEVVTYCDRSEPGRIVSQTYLQDADLPVSRNRKSLTNIGYFPQIAIKKENTNSQIVDELQIALVNGCWDTSNKIPTIVAEMHNLKSEEIQILQNSCNGYNDVGCLDYRDFINPSPRGSDSGIEADCADGNLSWLLNYKIHELPPVPDSQEISSQYPSDFGITRNDDFMNFSGDAKSNFGNGYGSKPANPRYSGPKKPPFTYTELIENALSEKGELTVSGIYNWISEHFPFYKQNDDRWKNSVRHNLSINPHFRKGNKAVHGAGHLWTIAQKDDKKTMQIKQRMEQFIQATKERRNTETEDLEKELEAATASILEETFNNEYDTNACSRQKQNIEVEFINVLDVPHGLEDFLSPPVPKQQIVQECGLGGDFLITDLNPNTLGLNLAEAEIINGHGIYDDDMSFEYYELQKE